MFIIIFSFSLLTPRLNKKSSLKSFLSSQPTQRILILISPVFSVNSSRLCTALWKHQGDVQEYTVFDNTYQSNICLPITAEVNKKKIPLYPVHTLHDTWVCRVFCWVTTSSSLADLWEVQWAWIFFFFFPNNWKYYKYLQILTVCLWNILLGNAKDLTKFKIHHIYCFLFSQHGCIPSKKIIFVRWISSFLVLFCAITAL